MSRKRSDFEVYWQTLMGGEISHKFPDFQEIAKLSPDYAEVYIFLKKLDDIMKEIDPIKTLIKLIEMFGMVDMMRYTTEITRLSMILAKAVEEEDVSEW